MLWLKVTEYLVHSGCKNKDTVLSQMTKSLEVNDFRIDVVAQCWIFKCPFYFFAYIFFALLNSMCWNVALHGYSMTARASYVTTSHVVRKGKTHSYKKGLLVLLQRKIFCRNSTRVLFTSHGAELDNTATLDYLLTKNTDQLRPIMIYLPCLGIAPVWSRQAFC